jgi:hypothetical protein
MSSTAAVAQSYNDTNVIGQVFSTGAANNTGKFLAAIGGLNGARRVQSQSFDMGAYNALDTPSQNVISESTSLTAGTPQFYAKTQKVNVCQIQKEEVQVSNLRQSATQQISSSTFAGMAPAVSEFDYQVALKIKQFMADWEYACLRGAYTARSAVSTSVAMGGLTDSTIGISTNKVNASSAPLDKDMIDELLIAMSNAGAPMERLVFVCEAKYKKAISEIYGFAPQAQNIGGVNVETIISDFGNIGVITTNCMYDSGLVIAADLAYIRPVVLPDLGQDVLMREFLDGGSAQRGYIEGFVSVDFFHESYHGSIYGID